MDRLTKHTPDNFGYFEWELERGVDEQDAISKLAAYEETGLAPREIVLLSNQNLELGVILEQYKLLGEYDRLCKLVEADRDGRMAILPFRIGSYVNPECGGKGKKIDAITIYEDGRFGLCFHEHGIREEYYDEWSEGDSSEYFSVTPPDKQNS